MGGCLTFNACMCFYLGLYIVLSGRAFGLKYLVPAVFLLLCCFCGQLFEARGSLREAVVR